MVYISVNSPLTRELEQGEADRAPAHFTTIVALGDLLMLLYLTRITSSP
jgi:hypothetical protein